MSSWLADNPENADADKQGNLAKNHGHQTPAEPLPYRK